MNLIEQRIVEIISNTINDLGFDIVSARMRGTNVKTLEVLIDKLDGEKVTVANCQKVSRTISALLDVEDVIQDKYYLEVSSSGVERPLIKLEDYTKFIGREVNIKLKELLNGKTRYQGKIGRVQGNKILLNLNGEEIVIEFESIKNAALVFTDEMFKKLLNQ